MNFSAEEAGRKWLLASLATRRAAMIPLWRSVLRLASWWTSAGGDRPICVAAPWGDLSAPVRRSLRASGAAVRAMPLPRPRPAEAPKAEAEQTGQAGQAGEGRPPTGRASSPPPQPSACRLALTETSLLRRAFPPSRAPAAAAARTWCGWRRRAAGQEARGAEAGGYPALHHGDGGCRLGPHRHGAAGNEPRHALSELDNFDSFECRGRNRVVGAKLSEHGLANALDVRGLKFANGRSLSLTDRILPRETRENLLHSVCTRFTTVLGPGSDWYHEDHIHLDLASGARTTGSANGTSGIRCRRSRRCCRRSGPDEAPPRETADEKAGEKLRT